ncbi:alpha/beta fold hydrolase [Catenulispora pinisilvae]|uniref:alpha/beta fold hydrolase n=1 Tax=Catenulispora pinisilvae TaxID=2705253 RepID=UPI0018923F78|nr:alpha/beta hydrolase [Catenulispora pinisilvae]
MRTLTLPYAGPAGEGTVEYALAGTPGPPTTLFLHGLAGSIEDTRPLASGVPGRKVFAHLPGHGAATGPDPLGYDTLAAAALAVADHEHATAAFGVSLGAATLLRVLSRIPDRFERVVLYLPAVADVARRPDAVAPHRDLASRLAAEDVPGVADALLRTQPLAVRDAPIARDWAERRAKELVAEDRDPGRWLPLATAVPLDPAGLERLRAVTAPVLVIAQEGDPAHPVETARRVAQALPTARLEVFDAAGALWGHRAELRALTAEFLGSIGNLLR